MIDGSVATNQHKPPRRAADGAGRAVAKRQAQPETASGSAAGAGTAPLDTYANNLDTSSSVEALNRFLRRENEKKIRGTIRKISSLSRVRKCGHTVRRAAGVGIAVDMKLPSDKRVSGFRGLYSCASVWACKRCAAVIGIERTKEIRQALKQWVQKGAVIPKGSRAKIQGPMPEEGWVDRETGEVKETRPYKILYRDVKHEAGDVAFLTLTIRHKNGDDLDTMWRGITKAWEKTTQANHVLKRGVPAYIRSAELTHGKNGFHIHLHVILCVPKGWQEKEDEKADSIFQSWKKAVNKLGFESYKSAFDLKIIKDDEELTDAIEKVSKYSTKASATWDVALELAGAHLKKAQGDNLTPQQILAIIHADISGIPHDYTPAQIKRFLAVYREYEMASHGKRQLTWSNGAKTAFHISEISDEELAESSSDDDQTVKEQDKKTEEIAGFIGDSWAKVRDSRTTIQKVVETIKTRRSRDVAEHLFDAVAEIDVMALSGFHVGNDWLEILKPDPHPKP